MKGMVLEKSVFKGDEQGHYFTWLCQIGEKIFRIKSYGIGRVKKIVLLWEDSGEEFYRWERICREGSYRPKEYFCGKQEKSLKNDQNCFFYFLMKILEEENFYYLTEESLYKEDALKKFTREHKIEKYFIELYISRFQEFFMA